MIGFVPIRLNNKRLPNKNILPLGGKPLCWHIFDAMLKSSLDTVYCYCSDVKIKDYIPESVVFVQRPAYLDSDTTLGIQIYQSFAKLVRSEHYMLCHATSPFIKNTTINECVDIMSYKPFDSAYTITPIKKFLLYKYRPLNFQYDAPLPRTQDLEPAHEITSGIFAFTNRVIESGCRIGQTPTTVEVEPPESIDIDTQHEYLLAQTYFGDRA